MTTKSAGGSVGSQKSVMVTLLFAVGSPPLMWTRSSVKVVLLIFVRFCIARVLTALVVKAAMVVPLWASLAAVLVWSVESRVPQAKYSATKLRFPSPFVVLRTWGLKSAALTVSPSGIELVSQRKNRTCTLKSAPAFCRTAVIFSPSVVTLIAPVGG